MDRITDSITYRQQRVDAVLYTQDNKPGIGVLRVAYGLFIPMLVFGKAVEPFFTNTDERTVPSFTTERDAWHFLQTQQEKEAWHAPE